MKFVPSKYDVEVLKDPSYAMAKKRASDRMKIICQSQEGADMKNFANNRTRGVGNQPAHYIENVEMDAEGSGTGMGGVNDYSD